MARDLKPNDPRMIAGRYELLRRLGEGGVGVVYEARNTWTGRPVALKLLHHTSEASATMRQRFVREARMAARISHPHVVAVLDMGQHTDGSLFIVQELLEGESLASRLATRGPLAPTTAVRILEPVIDALALLHEYGIVHRDVKPGNVMLARAGPNVDTPKLIDFGVAKEVADHASHDASVTPGLTGKHTVVGTPHYMSPEQLANEDIDGRVDVWAMTVTFYECITGQLPFDESHIARLIPLICNGVYVAPSDIVPGLPPAIDAVVASGLAVNVDHRIATVQALGAALRDAVGDFSHDFQTAGIPRPTPLALDTLPEIELSDHSTSETDPEAAPLRVGLAAVTELLQRERIADAFAQATGRACEVMRFHHYVELVDAMDDAEIDLAWLPPVAFVRARERGVAHLLLSVERSGNAQYAAALLGRRGVVDTVDAAAGKRAAWVDPWSAAGYLMPRTVLRRHGLEPDEVLAAQGFLGSHDAVLESLRRGHADITGTFCPIDAHGEPLPNAFDDDPHIRLLAVSAPVPSDTIAIAAHIAERSRAKIAEALQKTDRAQRVLALGNASRFVPGSEEPYRDLARALGKDRPT